MKAGVTVELARWLSVDAEEALVRVSDGLLSCEAFCHPCRGIGTGLALEEPLLALGTQGVVVQRGGPASLQWDSTPLGYMARGRVIDRSSRLLEVGRIPVELDAPLPGDAVDGDWIEFRCQRLDASVVGLSAP